MIGQLRHDDAPRDRAEQERDGEGKGEPTDDRCHGLVLLLELEADGRALQGEGLAHAVLKITLVVVVHDIGAIHEEGEVGRAGTGLGEVLHAQHRLALRHGRCV